MSGALKVLKPVAEAVWENFLQPLAKWTGGVAVSAMEDLSDVMGRPGQPAQRHRRCPQQLQELDGKADGCWVVCWWTP